MAAPLLIATNNPGKRAEIQALLKATGPAQPVEQAERAGAGPLIELLLPAQIGLHLEVVEDGASYAENASRKALAFCQASGLVTLADDSGLEVEALSGEPGIHSARYGSTGKKLSDRGRRQYLLKRLAGIPRPWQAHFHCTVAVAVPVQGEPGASPTLHFFEGQCPGEIIPEERGENGFGYDPIFLLPELGLTMAELSMAQKNQLSHRARAVRAALPFLEKLLV